MAVSSGVGYSGVALVYSYIDLCFSPWQSLSVLPVLLTLFWSLPPGGLRAPFESLWIDFGTQGTRPVLIIMGVFLSKVSSGPAMQCSEVGFVGSSISVGVFLEFS